MKMTKWVLAAALAGVIGMSATAAQAMTIADLMTPGTQLVQDDRIYSDFSVLSVALMPGDVTVSETPDGLRFSAAWNTALAPAVDAAISYHVAVIGQAALQDVGMSFGGVKVADGGVASVGETIFDLDNAGMNYNMSVYDDGPNGVEDNDSALTTLTKDTQNVRIVKDVQVSVNGSRKGSTASISFVDNSFGTRPGSGAQPPVIPEPATMGLLLLAVGGLAIHTRRRLGH